MSQQTTIRKLAELVNTPVEKLLEQLAGAGMKFSGPDQVVTSSEKVKLLGFLRRSHGKPEQAPEESDQSAKKITLNRRKQQEVTVNSGRSKTTVNVEVRQKRTYVKDGARAMTPDEERADILRKLEESRARNLAEQQALAEKDRLRDEAIVRAREEEIAAKERAEAEKKAAEEAAAAAKAAEALAATKPKRAPIDETAPRPPRTPAAAPAAPRSAPPPPRNDDRNNRSAPRNERGPGDRFAGQMHLSAADRARRGNSNNSNTRGRPGGRNQAGGRRDMSRGG
ncbi:translation initiation factor IF-2 associated domain-containing protein, partial [Stenotrophomonas maltophilia]